MPIDYRAAVIEAMTRMEQIGEQINTLREESEKLDRFVQSTLPLLSADDRQALTAIFQASHQKQVAQTISLTKSIRQVLAANPGKWMTVAEVRTQLMSRGFDFRGYISNPLASVSTTLKRLADKDTADIESIELEGVSAYRWKQELLKERLRQQKKSRSIREMLEEINKDGKLK